MRLMKYDTVIFDVDGTLWNACAISAKGMNNALKDLNVPKVLQAEAVKTKQLGGALGRN